MPVEGVNGYLDVESAALRVPQVGVANTNPQHILSVGSNLFVSGDSSDVLTVTGNVVAEGLKLGFIEIYPSFDLEAITTVGNVTSNTLQFNNATTGFVTTGNVEIGGELSLVRLVDVGINSRTRIGSGSGGGTTINETNQIAIGEESGYHDQGQDAIAIGRQSGWSSQSSNTVAIGTFAGAVNQSSNAVAVGYQSGNLNQGLDAVAIGNESGKDDQSNKAVAVGTYAGKTDQGASAVAVGYLAGETNQGDNSIILNATGVALNSTTASSFHVKPVRGGDFAASALAYTADGEIVEETNVHFDTAGNVGIGTDSPTSNLHVVGDALITGNLNILGTTTTIDTENLRVKDPIIELGKDNVGTGDLGFVMTRPTGNSNVAVIFGEDTDTLEIGYTQGNASQSTITMQTAVDLKVNVNGTLTVSSNLEVGTANLFVDTTTGNVGIGTASPTSNLHVVGDVAISSNLAVDTNTLFVDSVGNKVGIGTTNPGSKLDVNDSTSTTTNKTLTLENPHIFGFNTGLNIGNSIVSRGRWQGDGVSDIIDMATIQIAKRK